MKKIFIVLFLTVVSMSAFAQFEKGTKYVNASLTGFGIDWHKAGGFHLGVGAGAGYFVADQWMVLGQIGWNHQDGANEFNLGAGGRYYMSQNGFFFGCGLRYGLNSAGGDAPVNHNAYLTPEAGYCFYLNDHVSIEPSVYVDMCLNHFKDFTKIGLKVSFGYYF
ncbi:MAG: outer membrane beta-barrel protein [Bacteroidaceae bacterium]|nr:outer membrane beta-barrel protein [Bacteroidaceae bacterium]MBQ9171387.1 outer membrane beta-barrel protein [Bacteroidaceae bacterium]MBQ9293419.1 outer membrane beta-barrel protein [Bacteroidaceae bacterium]